MTLRAYHGAHRDSCVKVLEALAESPSRRADAVGTSRFVRETSMPLPVAKHMRFLRFPPSPSPLTLTFGTPILFLEPSCYSMFVEDYRELKIDNAETVAKRCFLFEKFVDDLLAREPEALRFNERPATIAIHPHCHAKSILNPSFMATLAQRVPGRKATVLDTACCGMAGAFGALPANYVCRCKCAALARCDRQTTVWDRIICPYKFRIRLSL